MDDNRKTPHSAKNLSSFTPPYVIPHLARDRSGSTDSISSDEDFSEIDDAQSPRANKSNELLGSPSISRNRSVTFLTDAKRHFVHSSPSVAEPKAGTPRVEGATRVRAKTSLRQQRKNSVASVVLTRGEEKKLGDLLQLEDDEKPVIDSFNDFVGSLRAWSIELIVCSNWVNL